MTLASPPPPTQYGFEFLATCWADPSGLSVPIASEEPFWGDAGTSLAVAAVYGSAQPEHEHVTAAGWARCWSGGSLRPTDAGLPDNYQPSDVLPIGKPTPSRSESDRPYDRLGDP